MNREVGNLSGVKQNERVVKCSVVKVLVTGCLSLLDDI